MKIEPLLCCIGSIALTFTSYNFVILHAGHNTKAMAIAFMGPVIGGVFLILRSKYLLGWLLTAFGVALEIRAKHLQVTYYFFFLIVIILLTEAYFAFKEKRHQQFLKGIAIMVFAAVVGLGTNTSLLWTTSEFVPYTIRGEKELAETIEKEKETEGIGKEAAFWWSYGFGENLTFLIPDAYGGASDKELTTKSNYYKALLKSGVSVKDAKDHVKTIPVYWGDQPFVTGPVYMGALTCFLFVLGLFLIKDKRRWWIIGAFLLSVLLAMGKNFGILSNFFYDYVPLYNKFRAVTMIHVVTAMTMVMLAVFTIEHILKKEASKKEMNKAIKRSLMIVGGLILILILLPNVFFDLEGNSDAALLVNFDKATANVVLNGLIDDRIAFLRSDGIRSLVFILLGAGLITWFVRKKIKKQYFLGGLLLLIITDLWMVDKRYFNNDSFVDKKEHDVPFTALPVDLEILNQEKQIHYRVYDITSENPFTESRASYFHSSIGGYNAAFFRRYDDIITVHFSLGTQGVLNMLNTKYLITKKQGKQVVHKNDNALGNAWFVNDIQFVKTPDDEIEALKHINTGLTAIVDERFSDYFNDVNRLDNPSGAITLVEYHPDYLAYQCDLREQRLAVFSEIYYEKGWNAYIDGIVVPHIRVNYVLRALKIPPGHHTIEFKFEPKSYYIGEKISLAFTSLLFIGALILGLSILTAKRKKNKAKASASEEVDKVNES
ncbi:MAG: hypothetical protein COC01_10300 [Bacteroidetes bacterium]|nr:MAG: hypothetical protein COC01_10300 [Bacteroidota bacterium]